MTNTRLLLGAFAIALLATACGGEGQPEVAGEGAAAAQSSSAGLPQGNVAAGAELAEKKLDTGQACVDCHGPKGVAPIDPSYPVIAGQYADYLAYSLQMYRDGRRDNALMASQAKNLTDQQIADLSAYFASNPSGLKDLDAVAN